LNAQVLNNRETKKMKNIKQFLLISSFFSTIAFSQNNVHIINYDKEIGFEVLEGLINTISIENKKKLDEINVINYVRENSTENVKWEKLDTKVTYNELTSTCFNNICKTVQEDLSRYKKGGVNKLLICGSLKCNTFNIETSLLPDLSSSVVSKKIQDEIKLNKKSDVNYIIVITPNSVSIPKVEFATSVLYLNYGSKLKLEPMIEGNAVEYIWTPIVGLSCSDCKNPEVSTKQDMVYTFQIKDKNGCESESKSIQVKVSRFNEDDPNINSNRNGNESSNVGCKVKSNDFHLISEKELDELFQMVENQDELFIEYKDKDDCNPKKYLSLMRNTQSDAVFIYDVPFSGKLSSCVKSCTWKMYRGDDSTISHEPYSKKKILIEDIFGDESGNKYVQYGFYTIRLNLTTPLTNGTFPHSVDCLKKKGKKSNVIYYLKLTFFDEDGIECGSITSTPLSLSDCTVGNH
jgi:hypothetical protein